MTAGSLYFHAPCFDGVVSAALAWTFLEKHLRWQDCELRPAGYRLRESWLLTHLQQPAAVVDFLYHPEASIWADHHASSILPSGKDDYEQSTRGKLHLYEPKATSCSSLLWRSLPLKQEDCLRPWIAWADKIDSAQYESPAEAVFSTAPALSINAALSLDDRERSLSIFLVPEIRLRSPSEVANTERVAQLAREARLRAEAGLALLRSCSRLTASGVVEFDVDLGNSSAKVHRYAPYLLYPNARYSAGVIRGPDGARVTAMRNPWLEFDCLPLGVLLARFGGGGHHRVGGLLLEGKRAEDARQILAEIVSALSGGGARGDVRARA